MCVDGLPFRYFEFDMPRLLLVLLLVRLNLLVSSLTHLPIVILAMLDAIELGVYGSTHGQ